jgi:pyruvate dehydrogenase kinase 2/3/4
MSKIFSYLYTTGSTDPASFLEEADFGREAPMAGLGYGLPSM